MEAHSACCRVSVCLLARRREQTLGALGLGLGEVGSQPQATCMFLPLLASPELSPLSTRGATEPIRFCESLLPRPTLDQP